MKRPGKYATDLKVRGVTIRDHYYAIEPPGEKWIVRRRLPAPALEWQFDTRREAQEFLQELRG